MLEERGASAAAMSRIKTVKDSQALSAFEKFGDKIQNPLVCVHPFKARYKREPKYCVLLKLESAGDHQAALLSVTPHLIVAERIKKRKFIKLGRNVV